MPLVDELQKLAALHASGSLSDEEFAAAKQRLFSGDDPTANDLQRRQALTQLDVDWMKTRTDLLHHPGWYPTRNFPIFMWAGTIAILLLTGLAFFGAPSRRGSDPLTTWLCIAVPLVIGVTFWHVRISSYLRAERAYRIRRDELSGRDSPPRFYERNIYP